MGTPIDLQDTVIKVAAPSATPAFANILNATGYSAEHGTDGETRVRVFGQATPYVRAGELVDSYSIDGLYDPADTTGQNILRTARDNGTNVLLKVLPNGTAGYQQECRVLTYTDSGDADGEYVECSFSLEAVGAKTVV